MSTFTVTAEQLTILEHPDADALEIAQVGGYRAVVAKGTFRTGDWAVYIPEQAILPAELVAELGLTGKLAGSKRNRVKPVRLRGVLSQGIVCRPDALADVDLPAAAAAGTDFAEQLGVAKWVPAVPVHMSGQVAAVADMLSWIDVENVKRFPGVFTAGERVIATEKLHGTAMLAGVTDDGGQWVSSKGFGSKRLGLVDDDSNLYWRAARQHLILDVARQLAGELDAARVGVFGEVFGRGVQDLTYGAGVNEVGYVCFDVAYDVGDGKQRWVDAVDLGSLLDGRLPTAPVLHDGGYDEGALWDLASGPETVSGTASHLREGLVVRPVEERFSEVLGGRAIVKFVSDAYLTRKGGTEYE